MTSVVLNDQLELADQLLVGRDRMLTPQDLPGRYGRVVRAVDHLLAVTQSTAVVAGGWAVWRHGYVGRVTQDIDIVIAADQTAELLRAAPFAGFDVLPVPAGRWPKLNHRETGIQVDLLPEGARPGTTAHPAPTVIPHPVTLGGQGHSLNYITLEGLIELKLAAGRARDEADVVELIRVNDDQKPGVREHLGNIHEAYVERFATLCERAQQESNEQG